EDSYAASWRLHRVGVSGLFECIGQLTAVPAGAPPWSGWPVPLSPRPCQTRPLLPFIHVFTRVSARPPHRAPVSPSRKGCPCNPPTSPTLSTTTRSSTASGRVLPTPTSPSTSG